MTVVLMKKISKLLTITLLCFGLLLPAACKKGQWATPPVVVTTSAVQQKEWQETINATGSLFSLESITITPEIEGRVIKIYFQSGQTLKQGEALLELDSAAIAAQLKKAIAQLKVSQSNYDRFYQLYLKKFYDEADLDQAKAIVESNQADVDQLNSQLEKTLIKAPFNGKIGLRQVSVGEYLTPGKAIADFQSLDPLYVEFSVPEVYVAKIQLGNKINLISHAFPDKPYEGHTYAIDSTIDQNTRTLNVRAKIPNPEHQLMPGLFTEVTIYIGTPKQIMIIPQTAIVYAREGNFVYRFIDHKAVKTDVTLGEKLPDNQIIITKGLTENDIVILGGQVKLQDGSNVMTSEEAREHFQKMNGNR
jgi:membrane fusion protein (multidrug efflux system)